MGYFSGGFPAQGDDFSPPAPTIELPRDPHATFEVPRHNGVHPYRQGDLNQSYNGLYGGIPYFPGYIDPGYLGPEDAGTADQNAAAQQGYDANGGYPAPAAASQGQYGQYSPEDGPAGPPPYKMQSWQQPPPAPVNNGPITDGLDHPEVTLIFNNGRPTEQVKSYAVTRTTLFILDGTKRRQIPISELDIQKTVEKNEENGVEFSVPGQPH